MDDTIFRALVASTRMQEKTLDLVGRLIELPRQSGLVEKAIILGVHSAEPDRFGGLIDGRYPSVSMYLVMNKGFRNISSVRAFLRKQRLPSANVLPSPGDPFDARMAYHWIESNVETMIAKPYKRELLAKPYKRELPNLKDYEKKFYSPWFFR